MQIFVCFSTLVFIAKNFLNFGIIFSVVCLLTESGVESQSFLSKLVERSRVRRSSSDLFFVITVGDQRYGVSENLLLNTVYLF